MEETKTAESIETNDEKIEQAQKAGVVALADAKKEVAMKDGNYTHTFKAPVEIAGKKHETITFYYDELNGEDVIAIEDELQDRGKYVLTPEVSTEFQTMLAARAAGVGADEIRRLPLVEFLKIKNKARDFLMNVGY